MANISGEKMRRVALPTDSVRGGLMTQSSILKVTANGTLTSPVKRGHWVLNSLLGTPPPPPPPAPAPSLLLCPPSPRCRAPLASLVRVFANQRLVRPVASRERFGGL